MSGKFDLLARLFSQIAGREPKGAKVSEVAVQGKMEELTARISDQLSMELDQFVVPRPYLEFWQRFGGEKALTDKMTTLYPPDQFQTSLSHLIFGLHHVADRVFGVNHDWLDEPDPGTEHAEAEAIRRELDEDADGDDDWDEFTETLTDALLEISTENLLRSLKRRAALSNCKSKEFRSLLAGLEGLYGKDPSKVTASMHIYFGRGILVSYEPAENSALIGFSSEEREREFRQRFPGAK